MRPDPARLPAKAGQGLGGGFLVLARNYAFYFFISCNVYNLDMSFALSCESEFLASRENLTVIASPEIKLPNGTSWSGEL